MHSPHYLALDDQLNEFPNIDLGDFRQHGQGLVQIGRHLEAHVFAFEGDGVPLSHSGKFAVVVGVNQNLCASSVEKADAAGVVECHGLCGPRFSLVQSNQPFKAARLSFQHAAGHVLYQQLLCIGRKGAPLINGGRLDA